MKVILNEVGKSPKLIEWDIDNTNGFMVKDKVESTLNEISVEATGNTVYEVENLYIDRESGLTLQIGCGSKGANFDIATNNPYFPIQTVHGATILLKYFVDGDGWSRYGNCTEIELELMEHLSNMDMEKVQECIAKVRGSVTEEEQGMIDEDARLRAEMMRVLKGY